MNKVFDHISDDQRGRLPHDRKQPSDTQAFWITTLFVQFRFSRSGNHGHSKHALEDIRTLITKSISSHRGDVVALADDAALAVFSGNGERRRYAHDAVEASEAIMMGISEINRERLAQDLASLRVAVGLDAGRLKATSCPRHPALDPSLDPFFRRARHLSDLNYQTPFPAFFASREVVDSLDYDGRYGIQNLGDVFVDGQIAPLVVYAILNR